MGSVVELDVAHWLLTWSVQSPDHCAHLHSLVPLSIYVGALYAVLCSEHWG